MSYIDILYLLFVLTVGSISFGFVFATFMGRKWDPLNIGVPAAGLALLALVWYVRNCL